MSDTNPVLLGVLGLCLLPALYLVVPLYVPWRTALMPQKPFTVFQANVLKTTTDGTRLCDEITRTKPDVIVLAELGPALAQQLEQKLAAYPHRFLRADSSSFGLGIFSRWPLADTRVVHFASTDIPALRASLTVTSATLDLWAIHTANPLKQTWERDQDLLRLADELEETDTQHTVIAGDFNATPFCYVWRRLVAAARLDHARRGRGLGGSWPVALPDGPWRLPIDHVLAGAALQVVDFQRLADIGSDHFPTLTTLGLPA